MSFHFLVWIASVVGVLGLGYMGADDEESFVVLCVFVFLFGSITLAGIWLWHEFCKPDRR